MIGRKNILIYFHLLWNRSLSPVTVYHEMLGSLPLLKHRKIGDFSTFFLSEAKTGTLCQMYASRIGKYWTALRDVTLPVKTLSDQLCQLRNRNMFFIKQENMYWDGKRWVDDWHLCATYLSESVAFKRLPNSVAKVVSLSEEQFREYFHSLESLDRESQLLRTKPVLKKKEINELLVTERLKLTDVIDAVIEINGIIGVGLISLGDDLSNHVRSHAKSAKRND